MATTESLTVYPAEFLESESKYKSASNTSAPIGKGTDNLDYAEFIIAARRAKAYAYYKFNLSAIPAEATIDSVSCAVKGAVNGGLYSTDKYVSICYGTAEKQRKDLTTDTETHTLNGGTWTRSELEDCRVKIGGTSSNSNGTPGLHLYGAELTVVYTYEGQTFLLKTNGVWTEVSAVYKKADGAWVEQEDLQSLFDTSANYVKGAMT